MSMSEKNNWKAEYKQLKQKIIASSEKDLLKFFPFCKTTLLKNDILNMITNEEKMDFDENKQKEEIYNNLRCFRQEIKAFKERIRFHDQTDDNLSKIKEITENLELKLERFQNRQIEDFEGLTSKEEQLSRELNIFNEKIEKNERKMREQNKLENYKVNNEIKEDFENDNEDIEEDINMNENQYDADVDKENQPLDEEIENDSNQSYNINLSPEELFKKEIKHLEKKEESTRNDINTLEKEIRLLGGKSCGWPDEDHSEFLKIRTKHKNNLNKLAFLQDCVASLALFNDNQIQDHIERFKKYCDLEEIKKEKVELYKQLKKEIKEKLVQQIDRENERNLKKKLDINEEKKAELQKRIELKEKVKNWKQKRKALEEIHNEKIEEKNLEKKQEKDFKLQQEKKETAEKLKQFKELKELKKIKEQEREQLKKEISKKTLNPFDLERIRQKEEKLLEKKLLLLETQQVKLNEKILYQEKTKELMKAKFAYVEPKLDHQTAAIANKKTKKFDPKNDKGKLADTFGGMLGKGMSRAVPSWRQGF